MPSLSARNIKVVGIYDHPPTDPGLSSLELVPGGGGVLIPDHAIDQYLYLTAKRDRLKAWIAGKLG